MNLASNIRKVLKPSASQVFSFTASKLLLCLIALNVFFCATLNCLAENAPKVRAELVNTQTVQVTIKSKISAKKSGKILVIRSVGESGQYKPYLSFNIRGSQTVIFTENINSGVKQVRYKSRLKGRASSSWSRAAKVKISTANESPEETPADPDQPPPSTEPPASETPLPDVTLPAGASTCPRSEIQKVLDLVNAARNSNGLSALTEHSVLAHSSMTFSAKMARTQSFSHDGWYENILNSGYTGHTAGQNIAYSSQLSGALIMNLWMNSPGHKANILSSSFSDIGIGCVIDSTHLVWWTQDFGA